MALSVKNLERCVETLKLSLEKLQECDPDSIEYEIYRNAVIKGFELTIETSGTLLKKALKPYFSTPAAVDQLFFKDIFRKAAHFDIIELESVERWFRYRDDRNLTAHDYGENLADDTISHLSHFVNDVYALIKALKNKVDADD